MSMKTIWADFNAQGDGGISLTTLGSQRSLEEQGGVDLGEKVWLLDDGCGPGNEMRVAATVEWDEWEGRHPTGRPDWSTLEDKLDGQWARRES